MAVAHEAARRIEQLAAVDGAAQRLGGVVGHIVKHPLVRNALSGTNIGHPLHPMLTDVPIGAWTMSTLFDTVGGREFEPAADVLVAVGIVAAVPTAATGLNDWSDTVGEARRVGVVHAGANVLALGCFTASLAARRAGRRVLGKTLGVAGFTVLAGSAYLGGHLSFVKGVNVNHNAFTEVPDDWTPALAESELPDGEPRVVTVQDVPVLLVRESGTVSALLNECSHAGGSLGEGVIEHGCVTCPLHGSTFELATGRIVRGPASTPQQGLDVRVVDGQIELRARRAGRAPSEH